MLRFDLDNENETVRNYRERVRQCEALSEYALAEQIRGILVNEQEHRIDLATALGKDVAEVTSPAEWIWDVKTVSTYPPKDLFTKDGETIARVLATKKASPKSVVSGLHMVQFFVNRAGNNLPAARKRELDKAKHILQEKARKRHHLGAV
jgi:hypothetical protein